MSTYAVVKGNEIINLIEWDGVAPIYKGERESGAIDDVIEQPEGSAIGHRLIKGKWADPNPPPPAPEPALEPVQEIAVKP